MFNSPYKTTVTAAHMEGKKLADCAPKAEKKYIPSDYVTPRRLKAKDYNCTEPARTRDGKNFPGGRHLRRAYTKLNARRSTSAGTPDDKKPGSMKG